MPQVLCNISLISLSPKPKCLPIFKYFVLHYSDEGDEIVECDNCGITVHEGKQDLLSHVHLLVVFKG